MSIKIQRKPRFGLCCIFRNEPIKFRQVTAKTIKGLPAQDHLQRLSQICLHNVQSLEKALGFVAENGIGAFRVLSPLFPRYTHPEIGYKLDDLPDRDEILELFGKIRTFRKLHDIRLSFHPDQFNVLSSPNPEVVKKTIEELRYQAMLAELIDADVINIHAGGVYGNKEKALQRLHKNLLDLPENIFNRLTLENDDVSYAPADLLPLCKSLNMPMVYDVHHHRCLPDGLSEEQVTKQVMSIWQAVEREPYFHLSSPKNGWKQGSPKPHADYINAADFPPCWKGLSATVDVEAKAKELAVLQLMNDLRVFENTINKLN